MTPGLNPGTASWDRGRPARIERAARIGSGMCDNAATAGETPAVPGMRGDKEARVALS
jgi:hypothetical protein